MASRPSASGSPASVSDSEQPPKVLGIWRIGDPIHRSDSAELFRGQPADAPENPRWDYVIKRAVQLDRPANRQSIAQSIAVSQSVTHPNLVCVLDGSASGNAPFLVMPRLAGVTMQQLMDHPSATALPATLWMVRQIAQAAEAMHSVGWIHGDIKPANAIVSSQGHVTLVDTGFARRMHAPLGNVFRGTPMYAAPEALDGNTATLPTMDVFSLGRLLWQCLTKVQAAEEQTLSNVAELVAKMVDQDFRERPTSSEVVSALLTLEIDSLHGHIEPTNNLNRHAA